MCEAAVGGVAACDGGGAGGPGGGHGVQVCAAVAGEQCDAVPGPEQADGIGRESGQAHGGVQVGLGPVEVVGVDGGPGGQGVVVGRDAEGPVADSAGGGCLGQGVERVLGAGQGGALQGVVAALEVVQGGELLEPCPHLQDVGCAEACAGGWREGDDCQRCGAGSEKGASVHGGGLQGGGWAGLPGDESQLLGRALEDLLQRQELPCVRTARGARHPGLDPALGALAVLAGEGPDLAVHTVCELGIRQPGLVDLLPECLIAPHAGTVAPSRGVGQADGKNVPLPESNFPGNVPPVGL